MHSQCIHNPIMACVFPTQKVICISRTLQPIPFKAIVAHCVLHQCVGDANVTIFCRTWTAWLRCCSQDLSARLPLCMRQECHHRTFFLALFSVEYWHVLCVSVPPIGRFEAESSITQISIFIKVVTDSTWNLTSQKHIKINEVTFPQNRSS